MCIRDSIHTRLHYICMFARVLLWCGYAGSSLEVKIETDSNHAVEIKTEADSNDIIETVNPLHDKPSTGMFRFYHAIFSQFIC